LAPDDPKWTYTDTQLRVPRAVAVHRSRFVGPCARRLGDEVYGKHGFAKVQTHVRHIVPRVLVPDQFISWVLTAGPRAIRLVRRYGIDLVMTSSSPGSVHFIGALVKLTTGAVWVADVRESLLSNPHRRRDRAALRLKQSGERAVAALVARYADAVVAATAAIAKEFESLGCGLRVAVVRNGCDFDDFEGFEYSRAERFRLTHTGSFYGERDPRPVMAALARSGVDVTLRFAGDLRPRDRAYALELGLEDRLELHGYVNHRRSCELQRDSEALLLLIPNANGRGRGVVPAKLFEYIAAARPILAAVPLDGEAATIVREADAGPVVDPDDVAAISGALAEMVDRFQKGTLASPRISQQTKRRLSRESRVGELAALFEELRFLRGIRCPLGRRGSS
jgi:glycosyltransferase involved in cell wall biosynthesis